MLKTKVISYNGFETINELCNGEDMVDAIQDMNIPGEFQGTLTVTLSYEPAEDEGEEE